VYVIVNQVPILEGEVPIGTSIALLDNSYLQKITRELKVVKELQTTISGVLSASSDGVFVSDMAGTVKYVNERASQLLTEPYANITGRPVDTLLQTKSPAQVAKTGTAEVDECIIKGRNCIVSHIPIKQETNNGIEITGVVSTVYLEDNVLTEEIARKWFSLNQQVQYYRNELEKRGVEISSFDHIVSRNPKFTIMKKDAQRIARSSSTVLLTGESGVGKGIFAQAIHAASPRAKNPFVKVNCAAIPETLLESELFGYAPGSFTGASKKGKPGYFERADGGTIFLDEIGDMPLSIQVKILHVLQEKEFMRVGGQSNQEVDVRIIAATNRDLREGIAKGTFREDLFYRLNVIEFDLPPLRERSEDILVLAESFIKKYNRILGSNVIGINPHAKNALVAHSWPGNIRELENAIERAANYVWEGEIGIEELPTQILRLKLEPIDQIKPMRSVRTIEPDESDEPLEPLAYRSLLSDVDKEMLLEALRKANGNKSAAARLLKISRSTFYEKLGKYGL
jgi:transcriptional regulator with PAS, ATPase and Fis domain